MSPIAIMLIAMFVLFFGAATIIVMYLVIERQKNASKAENHIWVSIIPKAGMERNYRQPIEIVGGISSCHIPDVNGQINEYSPVHVLGEAGEFTAMYPPGKMKFVQTPMQKIIYYEGDSEPISNVENVPIISGQLFANILNGSTTAAVDVVQGSQQESGVNHKSINKGQMVTYIILGIVGVLMIVNLVFTIKGSSGATEIHSLSTLIKQALGLK